MKIIKPYILVETDFDGEQVLRFIEKMGRVCYKSETLISNDTAKNFVKNIIKNGHESVIEHFSITVRVICDRGVTHELVRHRLASYSQESTRYCNYSQDKFDNELTFIQPCFWEENDSQSLRKKAIWENCMKMSEQNYLELVNLGASPQEARSILPNSLKTEIVMTMNLREWRHFFKLRTAPAAHPQMREVAKLIITEFRNNIPIVFDDIIVD